MKFKYDDFIKLCAFNKLPYASLILKSLLKNGIVKVLKQSLTLEVVRINEEYPLIYEDCKKKYERNSFYNKNYKKESITKSKPIGDIDEILKAIKLLRDNGYKGQLTRTILTSINL